MIKNCIRQDCVLVYHLLSPQACPINTYGESEYLEAQNQCEPCPAGYFCPIGTPGYPGDDHICPLGHFCDGTGDRPQPCPAGTYGDQFGLRAATECKPCKPGRECAQGSTTPGQPCPQGRYCPVDPNNNSLGSSDILFSTVKI